jgi:hypothetical protein
MNLALWIVQGLVAFAMTMAGAVKIVTPKEKLEVKMKWAKTWDPTRIKLLGLAEVLGAVGLIVPGLTGILPVLTSVAAVCLAILMGGAVKVHLDLKEPVIPPAVLGVLCLLIAVGRSGLLH